MRKMRGVSLSPSLAAKNEITVDSRGFALLDNRACNVYHGDLDIWCKMGNLE